MEWIPFHPHHEKGSFGLGLGSGLAVSIKSNQKEVKGGGANPNRTAAHSFLWNVSFPLTLLALYWLVVLRTIALAGWARAKRLVADEAGRNESASLSRRGIRGGELENTHHQAATDGSEVGATQGRGGEGRGGGAFRFRTRT